MKESIIAKEFIEVLKHPGHADQSVHGRKRGSGKRSDEFSSRTKSAVKDLDLHRLDTNKDTFETSRSKKSVYREDGSVEGVTKKYINEVQDYFQSKGYNLAREIRDTNRGGTKQLKSIIMAKGGTLVNADVLWEPIKYQQYGTGIRMSDISDKPSLVAAYNRRI